MTTALCGNSNANGCAVGVAVGLVRAIGICDFGSSAEGMKARKRSWQVVEFAAPAVPNQAP
jgi:hypothetical protein